jgi:hypothetical protein
MLFDRSWISKMPDNGEWENKLKFAFQTDCYLDIEILLYRWEAFRTGLILEPLDTGN